MTKRVTLLGFTKTGKTTYIAALWQSLRTPQSTLPFRIESPPQERTYLNKISQEWLGADELSRTPLASLQSVTLSLRAKAADTQLNVFIPDLLGEVFEQELAEREFSHEFTSLLRESDGFMLFVHPRSVIEPTLIEEGHLLTAHLPSAGEKRDDATASETVTGWSFESMPTEAALVELLQAVHFARHGQSRLTVSVVVSAWDLLLEQYDTAEQYLASRLPLLYQFATQPLEKMSFHFFGVSAQGGDYAKNKDSLLKLEPWQRVRVAGTTAEDNILTPLLQAVIS